MPKKAAFFFSASHIIDMTLMRQRQVQLLNSNSETSIKGRGLEDRSVERRKGGQIRFAAAWRKIRLKSGHERESNFGEKKWNTEEEREVYGGLTSLGVITRHS